MKYGYRVAILVVLAVTGSTFAQGTPEGSMRTWLDADYLMWWFQPNAVSAPLLTTGPLTSPTSLGSGTLGLPSTQILAGNSNLNQGIYSGFHVGAGWIDCSDTFGVEGNFWYLSPRGTSFGIGSLPNGAPLLARPIQDARTGQQTEVFVSAPNAFSGNLKTASSTGLLSADINGLFPVWRGCLDDDVRTYFSGLAGFRYLDLYDDLSLTQTSNVLGGGISFYSGLPLTAGSALQIQDNIHTLNQFYGGQIGARAGITWWRITVNGVAKIALGSMYQRASLNGYTTAADPALGLMQTTQGGMYVLGSNSGSYSRNMICVIPQGSLNFKLEITSQISLTVGYNILYVSNVARSGKQIDPSINRTLLPTSQSYNPAVPGPHQPNFTWTGSDFWAQGLNFGISLRF